MSIKEKPKKSFLNQVTVTLPEPLKDEAQAQAEKELRSLSSLIALAVKEYVDRKKTA